MSGRLIAVAVGVAMAAGIVVGAVGGAFGAHHFWTTTKVQTMPVRPQIRGIHPPTGLERRLAASYSPLLVFGHFLDDPWRPGPVASYLCQAHFVTPAEALADAELPAPHQIQAKPARRCASADPTAEDRAATCRHSWPLPFDGGTSCLLDLPDCTLREDAACYTAAYPPASMVNPRKGPHIDYYTRVVPVPKSVDADLAGRMSQLSWVFQYWFFYPFDDWHDPALGLRQVHEGDWEFAAVGVSAHGPKPLFVAYSHHCFGGWSWFNDRRLDLVHLRGSAGQHPVLYVADGSHALYTEPGDPNVDLAHCALGFSLRSHLAGVGRLRDHTVPAGSAASAALSAAERRAINRSTDTRLIWMAAKRQWVNFAEPWGEAEEIYTPVTGWRIDALGPAGPAFQGASWNEPVYTILCSGGWTDDSAEDRPASDPLAQSACRPNGQAIAPSVAAAARQG